VDTPVIIGTGLFGIGLVVWIVCAYLCYQQAPRFRRRPVAWGILGIVFGPIALFALYLLPKAGGQPGR